MNQVSIIKGVALNHFDKLPTKEVMGVVQLCYFKKFK